METNTCLDFLKSAAATGAKVVKVGIAEVMATNTGATAKDTALAASTAADRRAKAKVAADTADRLAGWVVAKVAVPVGAARAGVRVVDAACSAPAT